MRILDVVYNASNNELVRTQTLVKNAIVQVDATPFKQWYQKHYNVELGAKNQAEIVPKPEEIKVRVKAWAGNSQAVGNRYAGGCEREAWWQDGRVGRGINVKLCAAGVLARGTARASRTPMYVALALEQQLGTNGENFA